MGQKPIEGSNPSLSAKRQRPVVRSAGRTPPPSDPQQASRRNNWLAAHLDASRVPVTDSVDAGGQPRASLDKGAAASPAPS